jgi:triphosphoribosyl-dephospho-CoA synthase
MPLIGLCAQLACIWEATARKPGNVHRFADFSDSSYLDYIVSAAAIAPVMGTAWKRDVGETILASVQATRLVTAANTNLGIVLLLAPLATVAGQPLRRGLRSVLDNLSTEDARLVYQAIRLARPGGLGSAPEEDVSQEPTRPLREVMALAAHRDLIARQYANGFVEVFDEVVPLLTRFAQQGESMEEAIIATHLNLLARHPDSLIARKGGVAAAHEVSERAREVLEGRLERSHFDGWLREGGHTRNPGTTADLVAAGLFVTLREGTVPLDARFGAPC